MSETTEVQPSIIPARTDTDPILPADPNLYGQDAEIQRSGMYTLPEREEEEASGTVEDQLTAATEALSDRREQEPQPTKLGVYKADGSGELDSGAS